MALYPGELMGMYNAVKGVRYPKNVLLLKRFGYADEDIAQALACTVDKVKAASKLILNGAERMESHV